MSFSSLFDSCSDLDLNRLDAIIERIETEKLLALVRLEANLLSEISGNSSKLKSSLQPESKNQQTINNSIIIQESSKEVIFKDIQPFYFKVVAAVGSRLYSIYDGITGYVLRKTMKRSIVPNLKAGFFVHETAEQAIKATFPENSKLLHAARVLIKVEAGGSVKFHPGGVLEFEKIRPVEVITYLPDSGYKPSYPKLVMSLSPNERSKLDNSSSESKQWAATSKLHFEHLD